MSFHSLRSRYFSVSDPKHCVCVRSHSDGLDQSERVYVDHKSKSHLAKHSRNIHSLEASHSAAVQRLIRLSQVRKLNTFLGMWVSAAAAVLAVYAACEVLNVNISNRNLNVLKSNHISG